MDFVAFEHDRPFVIFYQLAVLEDLARLALIILDQLVQDLSLTAGLAGRSEHVLQSLPFGCSHKDYRRILTLFIAHGVRNVQRKVHGRPPFSWVLTRGFLKARGTQNRLGFMSSCGYRKTAEGGAPAKSDQNVNHPVGAGGFRM